jgi:hypothetical protein
MSQLSDFRRKVLKKSQEALSAELGYEKWQTYAAQERGDNPLPEAIKTKLRGKKYDYQGAWPDEEAKEAPAGVSEREIGKLEGRIDEQGKEIARLRRRLGEAFRLIQDLGRLAGIELPPAEPVE